MPTLPLRLPQDTANMSVKMTHLDSLEGTRPLMLPDPYAHTVFFANGGSITFGEGVVPRHPDSVPIEQAAEGPGSVIDDAPQEEDATTQEDQETSGGQDDRTPQTPSPTHALTPVPTPNRGLNWADEMEDLEQAPQAAPWSAALPHGPERVPQNDVEALNGGGTPEPTTTPASPPSPIQQILSPTLFVPRPAGQPLHPHMFQCPDELDQNIQYETYRYGSRGDIWVGLRSNLRTIIDSSLTEQEQRDRNRDACRLNFGSIRRNLHS
jgi:hypothetical protein